jgi:hypothetical protein
MNQGRAFICSVWLCLASSYLQMPYRGRKTVYKLELNLVLVACNSAYCNLLRIHVFCQNVRHEMDITYLSDASFSIPLAKYIYHLMTTYHG